MLLSIKSISLSAKRDLEANNGFFVNDDTVAVVLLLSPNMTSSLKNFFFLIL